METEVKVALIGVCTAIIPALIALIGICIQKKCKEKEITKPEITKPEITKPEIITITEIITKPEIITKWISCSRYDELPENFIYVGDINYDGKVYIGRFNNTPGKVNIKNDKIWNFWVEGEGSSTHGEVLTINGNYKWINITRGELIPNNAVPHSIDKHGDKVWVGKNIRGEPGKINCHDNDSQNPKMYNIWCHNDGRNEIAYILTIS